MVVTMKNNHKKETDKQDKVIKPGKVNSDNYLGKKSGTAEVVCVRSEKSKKLIKHVQIGVIVASLLIICIELIFLIGKFPVPFSSDNAQVEEQDSKNGAQSYNKKNNRNNQTAKKYSKYVFVGDSRYVGMSGFASDQDVFICEVNMGYNFLIDKMKEIKKNCNSDTALIIGLGVNDLKYSSDNYISKLNEMADTMDCTIYYMLVNPVDENKEKSSGYTIKNDDIDTFNKKLSNGFSDKIKTIDTNGYLKEMGFETVDGLHYTTDTYQRIYNYIKDSL